MGGRYVFKHVFMRQVPGTGRGLRGGRRGGRRGERAERAEDRKEEEWTEAEALARTKIKERGERWKEERKKGEKREEKEEKGRKEEEGRKKEGFVADSKLKL